MIKHNLTRYIRGNGIEIGALHNPLRIDRKKASLKYVDIFDKEDLVRHNPEISGSYIKKPDIIADAEDLSAITDRSLDFVIASHLLEHLPNPIKALKEFFRVLKPEGILYLVIPDKRYSFDKERPITSLDHIVEDYKRGADAGSDISHYREWLKCVELKKKNPVTPALGDLIKNRYRIHFHVWTADSILKHLKYVTLNMGAYFRLADHYHRKGDIDIVFILKKSDNLSDCNLPDDIRERYSRGRLILSRGIRVIYNVLPRPIILFLERFFYDLYRMRI